jgi:hypothetical protein
MRENRDNILRIYVSDEEKQAVKRQAAENGMSASTYGRVKILQEAEKIEVEA